MKTILNGAKVIFYLVVSFSFFINFGVMPTLEFLVPFIEKSSNIYVINNNIEPEENLEYFEKPKNYIVVSDVQYVNFNPGTYWCYREIIKDNQKWGVLGNKTGKKHLISLKYTNQDCIKSFNDVSNYLRLDICVKIEGKSTLVFYKIDTT